MPSSFKLPLPKLSFNTDLIKQQQQHQPYLEQVSPKFKDPETPHNKPHEKKSRFIFLEDEYAKVETMRLSNKPDRVEMLKKKTADTKQSISFRASESMSKGKYQPLLEFIMTKKISNLISNLSSERIEVAVLARVGQQQ